MQCQGRGRRAEAPRSEVPEMLRKIENALGPEVSCSELLAMLVVLVLLLRFAA